MKQMGRERPGKKDGVTLPWSDSSENKFAIFRYVGWTSVAVGVAALGVYVGRELRFRYKFKRRTPSDFYSHAGDELRAEFGVGI